MTAVAYYRSWSKRVGNRLMPECAIRARNRSNFTDPEWVRQDSKVTVRAVQAGATMSIR